MLNVMLEPHRLEMVKARLDGDLAPAYARLLSEADRALRAGLFSVTYKRAPSPSGDPHDYVSVSTYYWPDPNRPDGLPYLVRDGQTNPERDGDDSGPLRRLGEAVRTLALAYALSAHERYAERAARLLQVWFLEPETRMSPHLRYGQGVRGRCEGRAGGIIDTGELPGVVDEVGLLRGSPHWTAADDEGLKGWFGAYPEWLLTSDFGPKEGAKANNHGGYYDVQVAAYALFTGQDEMAKEVLGAVPERRIAVSIEPDGRQPHELARTRSFNYSTRNLTGLYNLALLGERLGLDFWRYATPDGRSLRRALAFVARHALEPGPWPFRQTARMDYEGRLLPLLRLGALKFQEPHFEALIGRLPGADVQGARMNLLYPEEASL